MTKSKSLSSDIDFIKEFEELRIKQKLLVETLNKKRGALKDEHLININSKLDFLVNLFQDANETPETDPHKEIMSAFEDLNKRIDSLEESLNGKLNDLGEKVSAQKVEVESKSEIKPEKKITVDYDDIETKLNPHKESFKKKEEAMPPAPDFNGKDSVEQKVEDIANTEPSKEKKKRKWF